MHTHKGVHVILRLTFFFWGGGGGGTSNDVNPMQDLFTGPGVPITLTFDKCYMHSAGWGVS